jgi:hypothetical protein
MSVRITISCSFCAAERITAMSWFWKGHGSGRAHRLGLTDVRVPRPWMISCSSWPACIPAIPLDLPPTNTAIASRSCRGDDQPRPSASWARSGGAAVCWSYGQCSPRPDGHTRAHLSLPMVRLHGCRVRRPGTWYPAAVVVVPGSGSPQRLGVPVNTTPSWVTPRALVTQAPQEPQRPWARSCHPRRRGESGVRGGPAPMCLAVPRGLGVN